MTSDALLAAIRADPDADLLRLVYADHLDDTGQPERAEFVRVQCELARLPEWDDRRPALEDREHELLDRHEAEWLGNVSDGIVEWEWRRGFVDELTGYYDPVRNWLESNRDPVVRTHLLGIAGSWRADADLPGVRELSLTGSWLDADGLVLLARSPHLSGLTSLSLAGGPSAGNLAAAMIGSSFVSRLRELSVGEWYGAVSDADLLARVLADAPLERLHLHETGLTAERLAVLLEAPFGERLRSLDVADNQLPAGAAWCFRRLSRRASLQALDLSGTDLGRVKLADLFQFPGLQSVSDLQASRCEGYHRLCRELADTSFWHQATRLRLHSANLWRDDFTAFCRTTGPRELRLLDLADNDLGLDGLRALADAPWGDSLTWLALSRNGVGARAVAALAASGKFTRLRTLHLAFDPHTDESAAVLASAPCLSRLRILTLSHSRVTDQAVSTLLDASHWRLSGLGLSGCLTEKAVPILASSPRLRRLQWLDLSHNRRLGGDALLPLAESPHLSRVCEMDIGRIDVSDRVRDALRQRLGRRLSD